MASDPFDGLLDLEQNFYEDGYNLGLADGERAGLVEGKVFGIEKGYEKALELGRLHGRALAWHSRSSNDSERSGMPESQVASSASLPQGPNAMSLDLAQSSKLPKNGRLTKHIEGLLAITDETTVAADNSDDSVTAFDDRMAKAQAKAKIIAAIVAEPLDPSAGTNVNAGIEDASGLKARH